MASIPPPTVIRVSYIPGNLSLIWQADQPVGFSYYLVTLLVDGKVSQTFKSDIARYKISQAFDSGIEYSVYVSVFVDGASASQSATYPVITEAPTMAHIYYNGPGSLQVEWKLINQVGVASYIATLDQVGGVTQNLTSSSNEVIFKVTLDTSATYHITVSATDKTGIVLGPPSTTYEPLMIAPTMAHVIYNGPDDLGIQWKIVDETGVAGYVATLDQKNGATWNEPSSTTEVTFKVTLNSADIYSVTVRTTEQSGVVLGPPSTSYAPIAGAPVMAHVIYDIPLNDTGGLNVQWKIVNNPEVEGYIATLDQTGGASWNQSSSSTETTFPLTLNPADQYLVSVRANDKTGIVVGPPTPKYTPILEIPVMAQVLYNGPDYLKIQWKALSDPEVTKYIATLDQKGGITQNLPSSTLEVVFKVTLEPSPPYTVTVRGTDEAGIVLGPASLSYSPIVGAPTMALITYNEPTTLLVQWQKINAAEVTGYIASLDEKNGPTWNEPSTTTEVSFNVALETSAQYTITVRGHDKTGIVLGPPTNNYSPIVEKPTVNLFQNDTSNVTLSWLLLSGSEGTQISLKADSSPTITKVPAPTQKKTIDFDVTSDTVMTMRSYGSSGIVLGPSTEGLNPVTETVALSSLDFDGQNMTVNWAAFQGPETIDGTEIIVPGQDPVSGPVAGPKSFPLAPQSPPETIRIRGKTGSILIGPEGSGLMPIYTAPTLVSMVWDQSNFIISWSLIPHNVATNYVITLFKNNVADPEQTKAAPPLQVPQATLAANTSYQVQVQGINNTVSGPPSQKASGPYLSTVTFLMDTQGRIHTESWANSGTLTYGMDPAGNITSVTPAPAGNGEA